MRYETIPEDLKSEWWKLRLMCGGLLLGVSVYLVVMHLVASGHQGQYTVLDYPGGESEEPGEDRQLVVFLITGIGLASYVSAFFVHPWLKRREPSEQMMPRGLPRTPLTKAFAQYRIAKIFGFALAESINVPGLIVFIMAGQFLLFALPAMVLSTAGMLALFPTRMEFLEHLEERLGDGGDDRSTEGSNT